MQQLFQVVKEFQFLATGLVAVLAALIGFGGVWYAQNRIAANAREERDLRERIAREERDHREAVAHRKEEQEAANRRTAFIHAISGELGALYPLVGNIHETLAMMSAVYEKFGKDIEKEAMRYKPHVYSFDTAVYHRYINDIGLLPPSLTYSLVSVYTRLGAKFTSVQPGQESSEVPVGIVKILSCASRDAYGKLRDDIHDVIMRLHAVRLGYTDPGLGKGARIRQGILIQYG